MLETGCKHRSLCEQGAVRLADNPPMAALGLVAFGEVEYFFADEAEDELLGDRS